MLLSTIKSFSIGNKKTPKILNKFLTLILYKAAIRSSVGIKESGSLPWSSACFGGYQDTTHTPENKPLQLNVIKFQFIRILFMKEWFKPFLHSRR